MFKIQDFIENSEMLGRKIREIRRKQGVTQAQVAGLANTGVRFVGDLENGKKTCQIGKMLKVLDVLGVVMLIRDPYEREG